ncbi:MAG: bifunctional heptose 7-phosphate kinase/heptose 1-phosphate adenyltransferase [Vampirovibrionales bacterium]
MTYSTPSSSSHTSTLPAMASSPLVRSMAHQPYAVAETVSQLRQRLHHHLHHMHQAQVGVLGDIALDEMVYGVTERVSREAPVVLLRHEKTDILLGGGGNAVHNVAALGVKHAVALGVMGQDHYQTYMLEALRRANVDSRYMLIDPTRPTTTKTRISGTVSLSVTQQIVRIDRESREPIMPALQAQLLENLQALLPQLDALMLSDYALGVIDTTLIPKLCDMAHQAGVRVFVDSHKPLNLFTHAYVMTPNLTEAEANVGYRIKTESQVLEAGWHIIDTCHTRFLLLTRSQEGMSLFDRDTRNVWHIPVFNRSEVFDVTGAGDTVIATFTVASASGAIAHEAAILGNLAASIVVKKFGAATTTPQEIAHALEQLPDEVLESCLKTV